MGGGGGRLACWVSLAVFESPLLVPQEKGGIPSLSLEAWFQEGEANFPGARVFLSWLGPSRCSQEVDFQN